MSATECDKQWKEVGTLYLELYHVKKSEEMRCHDGELMEAIEMHEQRIVKLREEDAEEDAWKRQEWVGGQPSRRSTD